MILGKVKYPKFNCKAFFTLTFSAQPGGNEASSERTAFLNNNVDEAMTDIMEITEARVATNRPWGLNGTMLIIAAKLENK